MYLGGREACKESIFSLLCTPQVRSLTRIWNEELLYLGDSSSAIVDQSLQARTEPRI